MIKMLTSIGGERFSVAANEVTDKFSPEEESRLVGAGLAEAINEIEVVPDVALPIVEMHANDVAPVQAAPLAPPSEVALTTPPVAPIAKPAPRKARG